MDFSVRISTAALSLLFSSSALFTAGFHVGKSSASQDDRQPKTEIVKTKTESTKTMTEAMKKTTETKKTR